MKSKSFLFIAAWIQPLKSLPLAERWKVLEAITEYATNGSVCETLNPMETIAFGFIRNEIDRMKQYRSEKSRKHGKAASPHNDNDSEDKEQPEIETTNNPTDANVCTEKQADAPYDILSESVSVSEPESEKKTTSSSMGACARGNAGGQSSWISRSSRQTRVVGTITASDSTCIVHRSSSPPQLLPR